MTANEPFKHTPLNLGKNQIRLFKLGPTSSSGLLTGKIVVWNPGNCPQYRAVSYTWGPPTPTRQILIEERSFTIRENLWHFLNVSGKYINQWLWIDQICIDQSAVDERNHQVGLMAQIYEEADQVLIWLGVEGDGSGEAIDAINTPWHPGHVPGEQPSWRVDGQTDMVSKHANKVQALFQRPYWYRLWILQEVFMAQEISVLCGDKTFPWEALDKLFTPGALDQGDEWAPPVKINDVVVSLIKEKAYFQGPEYRLCYAVETFAGSECQDVRDKVFGLLSLVRGSEAIPVEYAKAPREVFFSTISEIVKHEGFMETGELFGVSEILRDRMMLADISNMELFLLIDREESVNFRGADGQRKNNQLLWAVSSGHTEIVSLLLERDADLLHRDHYSSRNRLLYAASKGFEVAISILLTKDAGLETKDIEGRTALSRAAESGDGEAAVLLLERGAAILTTDDAGRTPLWWAKKGGFMETAELLLQKGIALEIKDKEYLDLSVWVAERLGFEAYVKILLEKGADLESGAALGRRQLTEAQSRDHARKVMSLIKSGTHEQVEDGDKKRVISDDSDLDSWDSSN